MRSRKICAILTIMALCGIIAACGGKESSVPGKGNNLVQGKPAWYWAPSDGNSLGGVGECGLHINGPSAQRQLAISRAIEDLARQKGVTVATVQEISQYASNNSEGSVQMNTYSVHTVDGVQVNARIREVWQDPETQRLYIWVTEIK